MLVTWCEPTFKSTCAEKPWFLSDTRVFISLLISRFVGEGTAGATARPKVGLAVTARLG